jgi:hypothetical protein
MKKSQIITLLIVLFSIALTQAQDLVKYDYVEIIVIQKMNNSGKIITIKEIEALKETSTLLNYMNFNNWEFIDRKAISELNNPIWMSYLFRKTK